MRKMGATKPIFLLGTGEDSPSKLKNGAQLWICWCICTSGCPTTFYWHSFLCGIFIFSFFVNFPSFVCVVMKTENRHQLSVPKYTRLQLVYLAIRVDQFLTVMWRIYEVLFLFGMHFLFTRLLHLDIQRKAFNNRKLCFCGTFKSLFLLFCTF